MRGRALAVVLCVWPIVLIAAAMPAPTSAPLPPPPCPVTLPTSGAPPNVPAPPEPMHYGNGALWTVLRPQGLVVFAPGGPGFVLPDGSLGMKGPWIPGVPGTLAVEGRRLDGPAPPARAAKIVEAIDQNGVRFFPTYLIFPTPGCWQVTGRVGAASLTFVTLVVKVGDGPGWRPPDVP